MCLVSNTTRGVTLSLESRALLETQKTAEGLRTLQGHVSELAGVCVAVNTRCGFQGRNAERAHYFCRVPRWRRGCILVGTLSDKIFAPFWPPNIVLFGALLLLPRERWWLAFAAAFPAHVIAEIKVGMPAHQLLVAFATNIAVALAAAEIIRRFRLPWFRTSKSAAAYIALIGVFCPAIVALGGAFVPIAGGGEPQRYSSFGCSGRPPMRSAF